MNAMLLVVGLFIVCIVFCEFLLQQSKIQSRLWRVLVAHVCFLAAGMICFYRYYHIGPSSIFIFWAGAFLSWFGIRSHIESSILIRMIFLLRSEPMSGEQLVRHYSNHYSSASRVEELQRAGLIDRNGDRLVLRRKGRCVLRLSGLLNSRIS